jgi:hypothetical protein
MTRILIILAVVLFNFTGICAVGTCWFILRDGKWAAAIALLVIAVDLTVAVLIDIDKPKLDSNQDLKRVKTLFRATGPAQTRIRNTLEVPDPHPDAHGEVTRAVYPREPMGV